MKGEKERERKEKRGGRRENGSESEGVKVIKKERGRGKN